MDRAGNVRRAVVRLLLVSGFANACKAASASAVAVAVAVAVAASGISVPRDSNNLLKAFSAV